MLSVSATIPVGKLPYDVAISPNGTRAYVLNIDDSTVSVIDTATESVIATIGFAAQAGLPVSVVVHPDGTRVYVAHQLGSVSVINTATNAVTASIAVNNSLPFSFLFLAIHGNRLYAVEDLIDDDVNGTVSVINTATNSVIATIPVSRNPHWPAVSPDGTRLYVPDLVEQTLTVIDTAANNVTNTIQFAGHPARVVVGADGTKAYVTDYTSHNVTAINTANGAVIAAVSVVGVQATGIAIDPDGSQVYVPHVDGALSAIDTATNTVTATIHNLGTSAAALAVTPDGSAVYVNNIHDDTVSVISTRISTRIPEWRGKLPKLVGDIIGGVAGDGGGWLVVGNHFYKIPPRPWAMEIIARAAAPHLGARIENRELGEKIRSLKSPNIDQKSSKKPRRPVDGQHT